MSSDPKDLGAEAQDYGVVEAQDSTGLRIPLSDFESDRRPPERNRDEDLIDTASHNRKLRELHAYVYKNSVASIFDSGSLIVRHPSYDRHDPAIPPAKIQEISKAISDKNDVSVRTMAYRYIECYNILEQIRRNLSFLQQEGFCNAYISSLSIGNWSNIAALLRIRVSDVEKLCLRMKNCLKESFGLSGNSSLVDSFELSATILVELNAPYDSFEDLGARAEYRSRSLRTRIGYLHKILSIDVYELFGDPVGYSGADHGIVEFTTYAMLRTLDLMVISYAGAHVLDPMLPGEGEKWKCLYVNGRETPNDTETIFRFSHDTTFGRRKLKCLDGYFGGQELWICHDLRNYPEDGLFSVYAHPETFSDIWGPMYQIAPSGGSEEILRYDLENGSIIPTRDMPDEPRARQLPNMIHCHWISHHDLMKEDPKIYGRLRISKGPIPPDYALLIGADEGDPIPCGCDGDDQCGCHSTRLWKTLNDKRYLDKLGVYEASWTKDTKSVSVNAGIQHAPASAVIGLSQTSKRIPGRTEREATMKRWQHGEDGRNPYIMFRYQGIEISQCSYHSRRVRLIDLLGTQTMRQWWNIYKSEIAETANERKKIAKMLELNPLDLVECYQEEADNDEADDQNKRMRECIRKLFGRFFEVLNDTGQPVDSKTLSALWWCESEGRLVKFPPGEFGWSRLGRDSYVVLEQRCLIFKHAQMWYHPKRGTLPSQKVGPLLFQSSLVINEEKANKLQREATRKAKGSLA